MYHFVKVLIALFVCQFLRLKIVVRPDVWVQICFAIIILPRRFLVVLQSSYWSKKVA